MTTRAKPFERIELNDVLNEALKNLETAIDESDAKVEVQNLPCIDADPSQMTQLFQNLVGNALKYRKLDQTPEVRVSGRIIKEEDASSEEEICEIRIKDNGIGFDQKYADRIFGIFQRLHGRGAYEGTGVGLAICKKVVERHRGQVHAEGEAGVGATFVVTLPVQQAQSESDDEKQDGLTASNQEV